MKRWFQQWLVLTPGIFLAAQLIEGIRYDHWSTLLLVAALVGAFNVALRPLLILFALPFVIFTFGLGIVVINSLVLYLIGELMPGFTIETWGSAFWGSVVISLISLVISSLLGPKVGGTGRASIRWERGGRKDAPRGRRESLRGGDVIDV